MNILTIATRNTYRHWQRSLVTILAMAFACAVSIIYGSLIAGMIFGSEYNAVSMNNGDIQIHTHDYRDDPDLYKRIENSGELVKKIHQAGWFATERTYAFGLMASDDSSSGVQLRGIDLDFENTVTQIHKHLMQGEWLNKNNPMGVVIGKKLARQLEVKPGDELIFIGQTADGYMANERYEVSGVLKTISAGVDSSGVFISNRALQSLLSLPAQAHEIAIMRPDTEIPLQQGTEFIQSLAPELEVLNWQELMPVIAQFLKTVEVQTMILIIFSYIAVATIVLNAMLMSVFERIHEFGVMKAIGVSPWQLIKLVYAESFLQTFIACSIGLFFGYLFSYHLQFDGIDMSKLADEISFAGIAMDPIWYARITQSALFEPIILLFGVTTLAVLYPAIKVALMRPVDAIHYQ
jgi:ABC-type lipoprotein release transport system permease subunit